VGDVTKYVITKAPCQVILTAPPAGELPPAGAAPPARRPARAARADAVRARDD
jgi:APA family basic amino acid/polyamine antiporter